MPISQDNSVNYFVHPDSYEALNLETPPPPPPPQQQPLSASTLSTSCSSAMAVSQMNAPTSPLSLRAPSAAAATHLAGGSGAEIDIADTRPPPPLFQQMSTASDSSPLPPPLVQLPTPVAIGRLLDKEFCYARKETNRYKVVKGSRFYRVQVGPVRPALCQPDGRCCSKKARAADNAGELSDALTTISRTSKTKSMCCADGLAVVKAAAAPKANKTTDTVTDLVAVCTADTTTTTVTTTTTRQSSFICSFAQTDDDLLQLQSAPTSTTMEMATTLLAPADCDMVDTADAQSPAPPPTAAAPRISIGDDDIDNMSDGSSLYHAFDEVYELEAKVREPERAMRIGTLN